MVQAREKYKCEDWGLTVFVEAPCGCEICDVICCDELMKPAKEKQTQEKKQPAKAKK